MRAMRAHHPDLDKAEEQEYEQKPTNEHRDIERENGIATQNKQGDEHAQVQAQLFPVEVTNKFSGNLTTVTIFFLTGVQGLFRVQKHFLHGF